MGRKEWREVPEERLVSVCAFHAVWALETAAGLTVRKVEERRIDGPAAFQRSSYHLYYTIYINTTAG